MNRWIEAARTALSSQVRETAEQAERKADKSQFWDEIIVAGEVDTSDVANDPVDAIGDASPTFDAEGLGDTKQDIEYSPDYTP